MNSAIYKFLRLTLYYALLYSPMVGAQTGESDPLKALQLNDALDPPQDILGSKSVVLISVPADASTGEWKEYANELQAFFAEEGIDAVAYFKVARQMIIPGQLQQIPDYILKREIRNLIFLHVAAEGGRSLIGMGPFNRKSSFYDAGAVFWTREFNELEGVFNELSTLFKTGAFARTNLLVNETPEFFDFTKPSFAANYASFPPELQTRKIAIPVLKQRSTAAGAHLLSTLQAEGPNQDALNLADKNTALAAVVADSLFDIRQVDMATTSEALLRRDGFTHILSFATTDSENMYQLFRYKNREEIQAPQLVKFYLRDLRNRNIFLGRSWDARADWQQALTSFLAQMKKELPAEGG